MDAYIELLLDISNNFEDFVCLKIQLVAIPVSGMEIVTNKNNI